MLIFGLEKEHQPPCQDTLEGAIEQSRFLNGFANDGCAGQVALERRDQRWCRVDPEDPKSFFDEHRRDGKTGTAAQIDDATAGWQFSRPLPHLLHSDSSRSTSTATPRKKLLRDRFVSIGSIHRSMVASRAARSTTEPAFRSREAEKKVAGRTPAIHFRSPLLVAQGLDRIQPRRSKRGYHAADQPHRTQNQGGRNQRSRGNDQPDISCLPVLGERAVKGQPSHRERYGIG